MEDQMFPLFPRNLPRTFAKEAAVALLLLAQMIAKRGTREGCPSSKELNAAFKKISLHSEKELRRLENDILPKDFLLDCLNLIKEAAKEGERIVSKEDCKASPQVKRIILRISANDRFIEKTKESIQRGQLYEVSDELMDLIDTFQSIGIIET